MTVTIKKKVPHHHRHLETMMVGEARHEQYVAGGGVQPGGARGQIGDGCHNEWRWGTSESPLRLQEFARKVIGNVRLDPKDM